MIHVQTQGPSLQVWLGKRSGYPHRTKSLMPLQA